MKSVVEQVETNYIKEREKVEEKYENDLLRLIM